MHTLRIIAAFLALAASNVFAQSTNWQYFDPSTRVAVSIAAVGGSPTTTWTKLADEWGNFSLTGSRQVRYGADTRWVTKTLEGFGDCTNSFFGNDPAWGTVKSCEVATTGAPSTTAWNKVAEEWGSFTVGGTQQVRYGADSRWITKSVTTRGDCTNSFFGNDPAWGTVKACEVATTTSTVPPSASTPLIGAQELGDAAQGKTSAEENAILDANPSPKLKRGQTYKMTVWFKDSGGKWTDMTGKPQAYYEPVGRCLTTTPDGLLTAVMPKPARCFSDRAELFVAILESSGQPLTMNIYLLNIGD